MNLQTRLTPFQPFLGIVGNKNWFPSSFEQILKLRILGSILADFPSENPPKKPYGTLGQSDFWYLVSLYTETARFKWLGHKKWTLLFVGHPDGQYVKKGKTDSMNVLSDEKNHFIS